MKHGIVIGQTAYYVRRTQWQFYGNFW